MIFRKKTHLFNILIDIPIIYFIKVQYMPNQKK